MLFLVSILRSIYVWKFSTKSEQYLKSFVIKGLNHFLNISSKITFIMQAFHTSYCGLQFHYLGNCFWKDFKFKGKIYKEMISKRVCHISIFLLVFRNCMSCFLFQKHTMCLQLSHLKYSWHLIKSISRDNHWFLVFVKRSIKQLKKKRYCIIWHMIYFLTHSYSADNMLSVTSMWNELIMQWFQEPWAFEPLLFDSKLVFYLAAGPLIVQMHLTVPILW